MGIEIWTGIIAGIFVLLNTVVSGITVNITKKMQKSVDDKSNDLSKKFDESTKFSFILGERASFDELTRITLDEPNRIRVTRFSPRKIERRERYTKAIKSRLLGLEFEDENYGKIEKYNRLTSLNSLENKESLLKQIDTYIEKECSNLVLKVTNDKNDFELVIAEKNKISVLCFHDQGSNDVLHSCLITKDEDLYIKFSELYEKLWNEDILLEIDFSLGKKHVLEMREKLEKLTPVNKSKHLSPIENIIHESNLKIEGCKIAMATTS